MEELTTSEAARYLEISVERVRQLAKEGTLRAKETPLGRLFNSEEVERLAREREGGHQ